MIMYATKAKIERAAGQAVEAVGEVDAVDVATMAKAANSDVDPRRRSATAPRNGTAIGRDRRRSFWIW